MLRNTYLLNEGVIMKNYVNMSQEHQAVMTFHMMNFHVKAITRKIVLNHA
jgi:hypothetical protein